MKERRLQKNQFYTVDLTEIKGRGDFKCPKCSVKISPNDITEDAYTVLEPITKGDCLDKLVLQCNKCKSQIHLIGFQALYQNS
jgi:hypothetical protein